MNYSRGQNSKRNLSSALVRQVLNIILPFISRTVVLEVFGTYYQGISSLFTSILQVLSLADLGFSSAIVFVLYKPIADKEYDAVCAIMAYFKRIYRIVGIIILSLGILMIPLLPMLVGKEIPLDLNIYALFLMYLSNTVVSYWLFSYKSALLSAMQREDLNNWAYSIATTGLRITQIVCALFVPNYYLFVLVMPLFTVLNNVLIEFYSRKCFPYITPRGEISVEIRQTLRKQVGGILINKIGDISRNACDNIFISIYLGLTAVTVYGNYYYIYSAVYGITVMLTVAIQASIGNSVAKESPEKNYCDLNKIGFIFSWFASWCAICMACLYQPFMELWMRENTEMLLSDMDMLLFVLYFFAITLNNIRNTYVNGVGLYWKLRLWYVVEAVGNFALNAVLGYFFGITGIIAATIITIFVCNFITRTNVLFRVYFKKSPMDFYRKHLIWFGAFVLNCAITYGLCAFITVDGLLGLFLKAAVCAIVPNIVFFALYCKTSMFRESAAFVRRVIKR